LTDRGDTLSDDFMLAVKSLPRGYGLAKRINSTSANCRWFGYKKTFHLKQYIWYSVYDVHLFRV